MDQKSDSFREVALRILAGKNSGSHIVTVNLQEGYAAVGDLNARASNINGKQRCYEIDPDTLQRLKEFTQS